MSGVHDEGRNREMMLSGYLSADGLEVIVDLTVLYRVIPTEAHGYSKRSEQITGMSCPSDLPDKDQG